MADFVVRPVAADDREWALRLIGERWGGKTVVACGTVHHPADLPGFIAVRGGERIELVTCDVAGRDCEVVTLDSVVPGIGVGTALIEAAKGHAGRHLCGRLWLITTVEAQLPKSALALAAAGEQEALAPSKLGSTNYGASKLAHSTVYTRCGGHCGLRQLAPALP